jgi:hypothetical protein
MALDRGEKRVLVRTVEEAASILASVDWPVRGEAHATAYDAALKVIDGHRSVEDAETSLLLAAEEAGYDVGLE